MNFDRYFSVKYFRGYSEKIQKKIIDGKETNRDCIRFYVSKKKPENELNPGDILPKEVTVNRNTEKEEFITDVVEVGELKIPTLMEMEPFEYTDKYRPAPGGVSFGHPKVTAGTLGLPFVLKDRTPVALSNNHVVAAKNQGHIGDPVYQPGVYDSGEPDDKLGTLKDYVEIDFEGSNTQDSGIVDCPKSVVKLFKIINDDKVTQWELNPSQGQRMTATGRTTEKTSSPIQDTSATVRVRYNSQIATFKDQILTGAMAKGGDSGSLGLVEGKATGLLFAGSRSNTVFNKIKYPKNSYNLKLTGGGGKPTAHIKLVLTKKHTGKGKIVSKVKDNYGSPLAEALVTVTHKEAEFSERTNSSGRAIFDNIEIQDWKVKATKEGYESDSGTIKREDFQ